MKKPYFISSTLITLSLILCLLPNSIAQVTINTDGSTPDASAMLDVKSTDKGMLFPRMTQLEIATITNPANGLTVFNTDDNRFYFYNDGAGEWKEVAIGAGTITPVWTCGSILIDNRDGENYNTVQIGTQCWMAENLNYETTNSWWYDNSSANGDIYGRLYTWGDALTACPSGWHLPTDGEWVLLCNFLGGENVAGGEMKESGYIHWVSPNVGATNSSGFTALPSGFRTTSPAFSSLGSILYYWSVESYSASNAYYLSIGSFGASAGRANSYKLNGFSARCLRD